MKIPFLRPVVSPHVFCLLSDEVTYVNVRRAPTAGFAHVRPFAYPPGSLGVGTTGTPLFTREAVAEAVEAGRRLSEGSLTRASVVFPDSWARMLPVEFESLPDGQAAARELIAWKVKKLLPGITAEMAIVSREMSAAGGMRRLLVAAAPAETIRSIELSFESAGIRVGTILPASLALFEGLSPTLSTRASGDYALVRRAHDSFVFFVGNGTTPTFFRQRPAEEEKEDHDQEIRLSLSYYSEKLQGAGISAVFLHDEAPGEGTLGEAFPVPPQPLSGSLFGGGGDFDDRVRLRPELASGFAAVHRVGHSVPAALSKLNFAKRPFRDDRPILVAVGVLLAAAAILLAANLGLYTSYQRSVAGTNAQIDYLEKKRAAAANQARDARNALDTYRVSNLALQSRGLLRLAAERRFSWTALLGRLERVLPPEVRVTHLAPQFEDEQNVAISLGLMGKDPDSVVRTISALSRDPVFSDVSLKAESTPETGVSEGHAFQISVRYLSPSSTGGDAR